MDAGHPELSSRLFERIEENRADNLEKAIDLNELLLSIKTEQSIDRAKIKNNLANAYRRRIRGDYTENIEKAIRHFEEALSIGKKLEYTEDTFYAGIKTNLAFSLYSRRIKDRSENARRAITLCKEALIVRTKKKYPKDWAQTTYNLANAYTVLSRHTDQTEERAHSQRRHSRSLQRCSVCMDKRVQPYQMGAGGNFLGGAYLDRRRRRSRREYRICYLCV